MTGSRIPDFADEMIALLARCETHVIDVPVL